jgi:hypothetical protein
MPGDFASNQASAICPWSCSVAVRYLFHQVDDGLVGFKGFGSEAGKSAADVGVGERLGAADRAGEETPDHGVTRAPNPDAKLLACREHLCLRVTRPERVLAPHRGDGLHGMRPATVFPLASESPKCPTLPSAMRSRTVASTSSIGTSGIDSVLVQQVNPVTAGTPQHSRTPVLWRPPAAWREVSSSPPTMLAVIRAGGGRGYDGVDPDVAGQPLRGLFAAFLSRLDFPVAGVLCVSVLRICGSR